MIKQATTLTVFKKIITAFGFALIANSSSTFAQSSSDQVTTLLEIQALRQEVAQLRDMVERQQYEIREFKSEFKSQVEDSNATIDSAPTPTQSNTVSNIINSSSTIGLGTSNTQQQGSLSYQSDTGRLSVPSQEQAVTSTTSSVVNQVNTGLNSTNRLNAPLGTGAIDASNVPVAPTGSTVRTSTTLLPNNQTLPGTSGSVQQAVTQNIPATTSSVGQTIGSVIQSNAPSVSGVSVDEPSNATNVSSGVGYQAQRVFSSQTAPTTSVASGAGSNVSVNGIKPVETIQPVLSIPSSAQLQQNVPNQPSNIATISENDFYQQGFDLLKESKHGEAITVFQKQIKQYPQGELADDAYYWIAESLYVERKLDESKKNFRAIIDSYPKGERAPDAMLKLAYIEQEQGNIIESRMLLQEVVQFHPQSDAALSAKNRLSEIN